MNLDIICAKKHTSAGKSHIIAQRCGILAPLCADVAKEGCCGAATKRLHQFFLMAKDSVCIAEFKELECALKLKISATEKEITAVKERKGVEDDII